MAAAIPAGGLAARFGGANKATLVVGASQIVDRQLFVNVNTPHDYERAKGLIELKPEPTEDRITTGRSQPTTDTDS